MAIVLVPVLNNFKQRVFSHIIVTSRTVSEHLEHLDTVEILYEAGLNHKVEKCKPIKILGANRRVHIWHSNRRCETKMVTAVALYLFVVWEFHDN